MAIYSAGMTAAGAGTTLRPILTILSTAAITPVIKEIALFNTTATSCTYELVQLTAGTAGATVTANAHRTGAAATPLCLAKQLYTADATIGTKTGYRMVLGAAIGSGVIMPVMDVTGALGATAGLGLVAIGTGQVCEVRITWEE